MKRDRLYVGYIFGFWQGLATQQNVLNGHSPKTLGGCFQVCVTVAMLTRLYDQGSCTS
jgi:hypothetical protein